MPFTMPDSTILATDIFLPILQDSLTVEIELDFLEMPTTLEILPRGFQYTCMPMSAGIRIVSGDIRVVEPGGDAIVTEWRGCRTY
ncbi:MAG: hypothetical protein GY751_14930 [Bacteroidetes bacterium]|nr:hypothetical protein [Bacteroidota bacterium]